MMDQAAEDVVLQLAERLADPETVASTAQLPRNIFDLPNGPYPIWAPLGLSDSHSAVSLLFTELAASAGVDRARQTHAHLAAGMRLPAPEQSIPLFDSTAGLAFAARAANRVFGGYQRLLGELDPVLAEWTKEHMASVHATLATGAPVGIFSGYDHVSGPTGMGRYLLARTLDGGHPSVREAVTDVLQELVAMAISDDVLLDDARVPAWWVHHDWIPGSTDESGHLNTGMAHGIAGPLALLSTALTVDVVVPDQHTAIERLAVLLDGLTAHDDAGPYWPSTFSIEELSGDRPPRSRKRDAWCYGTLGIGRAMYLAGVALDDPTMRKNAAEIVLKALERATDVHITDMSLCHGWAGLLHIGQLMAWDTGDPAFAAVARKVAHHITRAFDLDAPFGYDNPIAGKEPMSRPGFLEGAAGIGLALHAYATDTPPASEWDIALGVR